MIANEQIFGMIKRLLSFPYPTICRHSVAADLLSLLEESGEEITDSFAELAKHIIEAQDQEALHYLSQIQGAHDNAT